MGRKRVEAAPVILTPQRAARLYRMLTLLGTGPQTRQFLLRRLRLDIRGFYRDLEALRSLGIEVAPDPGNKYALLGTLDDALAHLPFPDPGLNVRDALQLADGSTAAHRRLRQRINSFLGGSRSSPPLSGPPNKPR
jgi:predicted DNA-binding transcriptional regulator YafY